MPLLRLSDSPTAPACRDCKFAGHALQRLGHAEAGGRGAGAVSRIRPACGWTPTACNSRGSHEQALAAFRDGKVRILLGTQMIAKGLDFPNVTLVGVINADTALQPAGFPRGGADVSIGDASRRADGPRRTGRPRAGADICPDSPAILAAVRHDLQRLRRARAAASRGGSAIRRLRRWCGS